MLIISLSIKAQDVKYGIKAGANFSIFGNDVKSKIGFQAGGFATIDLSDEFSLQPELFYLKQEFSRDNYTLLWVTGSGDFKLSYLYMPILFKYYVADNLFLEMGPQLGYRLKSNVVLLPQSISESLPEVLAELFQIGVPFYPNVDDIFKKFDVGMNFGAGYDLSDAFSIDLRYNVGITKMAKSDYVADLYNRNSFISLSVQYAF